MAVWLTRAGSHGEYEQKFIQENRVYLTWDNLDVNPIESIVILGDPKKTIMRHQLRLIQTVDTKGNTVVILTNDFEISALEISEIYRSRWKIELFFKWVKHY